MGAETFAAIAGHDAFVQCDERQFGGVRHQGVIVESVAGPNIGVK